MYVLAQSVAPADLHVLGEACSETGLALHDADPEEERDFPDVLLASFHRVSAADGLTPAQVKGRGGYPIAVLDEVAATDVLRAVTDGFSFTLASPLRRERVVETLGYLKSVTPPESTQVLTLLGPPVEGRLRLSSGPRDAEVSHGEAQMLRTLADRPGQIVARGELERATGEDNINRVSSVLKQKLEDIDSGAKILKVPHLGFRLVGTVREADAGTDAATDGTGATGGTGGG
ncbi:helix-turn-helix domain-containing protein [Streptomyces sp. AJS327]|uniref:helix-turn-helix domain-containing protein n=1 Tax=Streptomyces sp. AJS327 TaxID=2545265 RepID=UPI0015E02661|nr:helix-turn-helix domain-containing protein [Streptomyces sp. AJS327]MBA0052910.1 helix-turn-helix domain-containing protein [Streptomyces sp. AJS327]